MGHVDAVKLLIAMGVGAVLFRLLIECIVVCCGTERRRLW